jgi:hypothetical protein
MKQVVKDVPVIGKRQVELVLRIGWPDRAGCCTCTQATPAVKLHSLPQSCTKINV